MRALAIDIGGSKLGAAVVDDDGGIVRSARTATPRGADPDRLFDAVTATAEQALRRSAIPAGTPPGIAGVAGVLPGGAGVLPGGAGVLPGGAGAAEAAAVGGIGVAAAGPLDQRTGTASPVNMPAWRGFPLRERLAERYRLPVTMLGDAVGVAVAEHWRGAARGRQNVLGMVVSTGIGGGLILAGRLVAGSTGNAGHIGHMPVDPAGPDCACGGIGCLEAIASGTAIGAWTAARTTGRSRPLDTAVAAAEAARTGDPVALLAFRRAGHAIGAAVAGVVTLLDLDLVVIGGGVAAAGAVLFDPIAEGYTRHAALGYARAPRIVPAMLGGDSGLIGAAAVVLRPDRYGC